MIEFTVNGEARQTEVALTISAFLADHGIPERVVVVEFNGEILARGKFADTPIKEGDNLEIVQMMAGG